VVYYNEILPVCTQHPVVWLVIVWLLQNLLCNLMETQINSDSYLGDEEWHVKEKK